MAGNVINTGLNLMNTAYNGAGGTVLSGDAVKGGYFVTDTIANIPSWSNVQGTLCYCTGDSKFYQYNGSSWAEKEFGTNSIATSSVLGLVKSSTTGTTANRDYNVQVKSDGTMKVNVPWTDTDTNTWRGIQDNLTSTSTTDSLSAKQGKELKALVDGKLSTSGGTLNGNLAVTGTTSSTGLITQGSPSSDSTITSMNRFAADLFVSGNGSAPNSPKVAGFYLGKSSTDENRHMDIVSGADYSYIDFNKASNIVDYQARCLVNVTTGNISWQWDNSSTDKTFNVAGTIKQNGTAVSLDGHGTHVTAATVKSALGTGTGTTKYLREDGSWQTPPNTNTTYGAGVGLELDGTTFKVKIGYTTSGKNYKVNADPYGNLYVNVPWTDNNTTYSFGTGDSQGQYKVGSTNYSVNGLSTSSSPTFASVKATSDRRLKENIKEFKVEKSILDLPIVEFDYKQTKQHTIGCIAQDLQEICPEIVSEGEDGYLRIEEGKIVYLLLNEVKKLKSEVELLKQKNN